MRRSRQIEEIKRKIYAGYPQVQKDLQMIACTPDHVIPMLKMILEVLRPGIFSFWLDGPVSAAERKRCLELLNRDVIPALREHGKNSGWFHPSSVPRDRCRWCVKPDMRRYRTRVRSVIQKPSPSGAD